MVTRIDGGTTTESVLGLNHSFTVGTVQDGDWLFCDFPITSSARNITQTAGPTLTQVGPTAGANQSGLALRAYKRKLTAADSGATFTLTNDVSGLKASISWIVLRDLNQTDAVADFNYRPATGVTDSATTNHPAAAIASAASYGVPLVFAADFRGSTQPNTSVWTPPAGYTKDSENFSGGTTNLVSSVCAYASGFSAVAAGAAVSPGIFQSDVSAFGASFTLILKLPNVPPTVSAGVDQVVGVGQPFTLTGEASDSDGSVNTVAWSLDSKPAGAADPTLTGASTSTATSSGGAATPGDYVYRFTATDDAGTPNSATMTLHVVTATPRPNALIAAGGCVAVGAADIPAALADESPTSYAETGANPAGTQMIVGYPGWAPGQETWDFSYAKSDNTAGIQILAELLCGSTVIDSVTVTATTTPQTATRVLTSAMRALITNRQVQSQMRRRYTFTTV